LSIVEMKEVRECRGNSDERTGDSFSEQSARRRYSKEKTTQQTNGLFDKERSDDAVLIDRDVRSVKPICVFESDLLDTGDEDVGESSPKAIDW
jgi:hypothetical protein